MITATCFCDQTVAILGLGRTGLNAAQALTAGKANVLSWDDNEIAREAASSAGLTLHPMATLDWSKGAALLLSPGIPHEYPQPHPIVLQARQAGTPIISDIDILGRCFPTARYVGITGTNGKTTTTALIGHILQHANLPVQVGGNIGTSVLSLTPPGEHEIFVLEMSSYQLELTHSITFDLAVLLNITPDHLARHGGMAGYIAAKKQIFAQQNSKHSAIIGIDSPDSQQIYQQLQKLNQQNLIPITAKTPLNFDVPQTLSGPHNHQNAAAAYAVTQSLGVGHDTIAEAILTFHGPPHRQELITTIGNVSYINDSKATNVAATLQALARFENIYWILGGQFKEENLELLYPALAKVRHGYIIGEDMPRLAQWLEGKIPCTKTKTLEHSVELAVQHAHNQEGPAVVLLSPACASFDQFKDFEERGQQFRYLVQSLAPQKMIGMA